MYFSAAVVALISLAVTRGAVLGKRALSGQATYYGGNLAGGTCSFLTYTLPSGIFGTALSDSNWDNAAECGACVSVTGPDGNSITAMIVDECPGCGTNHLDLFPNAFSTLASPSTGIIDVSWSYVTCPITSPLQVHLKTGVSAYWFSMQVVNAIKRVATLEVSTDGGSTWKSTTRQTYNFFENASGFGSIVDVRVTSIDGDIVIIDNVSVTPDLLVTASGNFGGASGSTATKAAVVPSSTSSAAVMPKFSTARSVSSTSAIVPAAKITSTSTPAGANFIQVLATSTTTGTTTVSAAPSSSITSAPFSATSTSFAGEEITYVTIDGCPA